MIELKNIPIDQIRTGERFRKSYKGIPALTEDIKQKGIINPIAVKQEKEDEFLLIAGGRRLLAIQFTDLKTIPARVYPATLDDLSLREIELMENVSRETLDFVEKAAIIEHIHQLQLEKQGPSKEKHTSQDTADLLNVSPMKVSRARKVHAAIEQYGKQISSAKTQGEALERLKKLEAKKKTKAELLSSPTILSLPDQGKQTQLVNSFLVKDFFTTIPSVPDKAVTLVEINLPINFSSETILLDACERVMATNSWLLHWCTPGNFLQIKTLLDERKLHTNLFPIICNNAVPIPVANPDINLSHSYKMLLYAAKGTPSLKKPGNSNVFTVLDSSSKPSVELLTSLLQVFLPANSHFLSPFVHEGNILLAGNNNGCTGFGFSLNEEKKALFEQRVLSGTFRNYS